MIKSIRVSIALWRNPPRLSFAPYRLLVSRPSITEAAVLREEDLEEQFVKGWGKGGQAVNRMKNCVVLVHKPTGLVVKCHTHRGLHHNQREARKRMQDLLYQRFQPELSPTLKAIEKKKRKKSRKLRRRKQKFAEETENSVGNEEEEESESETDDSTEELENPSLNVVDDVRRLGYPQAQSRK